MRFFVDDLEFVFFEHRLAPEAVNSLYISGRIKIYNVIYKSPKVRINCLLGVSIKFRRLILILLSKKVIIQLREMFWRQIGGHFRKIVSSRCGIVWALSYDNSAYYYTNVVGNGAFSKGLNSEINPMTDTQTYYIYENQRWNPLTGKNP